MFDNALNILTEINIYSVPLIIIVCVFLLLFLSNSLTENMKTTLLTCTIIWVIFFGYKVFTGKDIYHLITELSQKDIEADRYRRVMIDGREVIYDKDTNEIVKPTKK